MVAFLAERIMRNALDYAEAVTKRPDLKAGINVYLSDKGRTDLIVV